MIEPIRKDLVLEHTDALVEVTVINHLFASINFHLTKPYNRKEGDGEIVIPLWDFRFLIKKEDFEDVIEKYTEAGWQVTHDLDALWFLRFS